MTNKPVNDILKIKAVQDQRSSVQSIAALVFQCIQNKTDITLFPFL